MNMQGEDPRPITQTTPETAALPILPASVSPASFVPPVLEDQPSSNPLGLVAHLLAQIWRLLSGTQLNIAEWRMVVHDPTDFETSFTFLTGQLDEAVPAAYDFLYSSQGEQNLEPGLLTGTRTVLDEMSVAVHTFREVALHIHQGRPADEVLRQRLDRVLAEYPWGLTAFATFIRRLRPGVEAVNTMLASGQTISSTPTLHLQPQVTLGGGMPPSRPFRVAGTGEGRNRVQISRGYYTPPKGPRTFEEMLITKELVTGLRCLDCRALGDVCHHRK